MEILIVCSGNIIRSPLAEGLLRSVLAEIGVKDVVVTSAGTLGISGRPADPQAVRLARERGFRIDAHVSRGLTERALARADMIIVMEEAHLRVIEAMDRAAAARTRLIREFETSDPPAHASDLGDPIGAGEEALAGCFEILEGCILNLAFHLKYRHGP